MCENPAPLRNLAIRFINGCNSPVPFALGPAMDTLAEEEQAWTQRGRLPVHPGHVGHAAIAEALRSAVIEAPSFVSAAR